MMKCACTQVVCPALQAPLHLTPPHTCVICLTRWNALCLCAGGVHDAVRVALKSTHTCVTFASHIDNFCLCAGGVHDAVQTG